MSAKKATHETATGDKAAGGFSADERAAMKERAKELRAEARTNKSKEEGERDVLAQIAEMPQADRVMAERIHAIVKEIAPDLSPRTWYGMPAYAKDGKIVCFFKGAHKFKSRHATLGFEEKANLDDGAMWPTSYALKKITDVEAARITELVKRASS